MRGVPGVAVGIGSGCVAIVAPVRIAIGSDHAGFALKSAVAPSLAAAGHELIDVGTDSEESVDYPDPAARAAHLVESGEAERAVLVCGSGVGVAIVANKVDGVRAVNAHDAEEAEMSRRHNDANVLTLAGRRLEAGEAAPILRAFLETAFEGGRHARRVAKIAALEHGGSGAPATPAGVAPNGAGDALEAQPASVAAGAEGAAATNGAAPTNGAAAGNGAAA